MASAVSAVGSIFSGITASGVATAASVVGTGMSAYSIYKGGQDAEDSAQQQQASLYQTASENAYIANLNRQIAEREAVAIEGRGVAGVAMKRKEIAALLAYQRTQEAITGFRYEGTPVDIAYESAREGEEDVAMIWSNALIDAEETRARGEVTALIGARTVSSQRSQADIVAQQGTYASQAGQLGSASTLLQGAAQAYSMYKGY